MTEREYGIIPIKVNGKKITKVVIDPHIDRHHDIFDDIVINLVRSLADEEFLPVKISEDFEYYVTFVKLERSYYRLVWLFQRSKNYIGVLTAFRDRNASKKL